MVQRIKKIIKSKEYRIIDIVFFVVMLFFAAVSMFTLCYRQAMTTTGSWPSDIGPYIEEMLGTNTRYSFPYPVMFVTAKLINTLLSNPQLSMTMAVTLFNVLAVIITKVVIEKETDTKLLSTIVTLCIFFSSMIYADIFQSAGLHGKYIGIYSLNPWHNHTYMAARPFMILAFIFGVYVLDGYEKDFTKNNKLTKGKILLYISFSIAILLTTMTKPSYTLVHMGAAGIIMLYRLFKCKFQNFRQTFICGCLYLPTIAALLYQFSGVFTGQASDGKENGIGIGILKVWSHYCDNIPLAILLAALFPFVVLIIHRKELKTNTRLRFAWQVYLVGIVMWCVFFEKGNRLYHGNFQWGYICGLFVVFLASVILLLKDTKKWFAEARNIKNTSLLALEWITLGFHTIMGLNYFYLITVFGSDYF